MNPDRKLYPQPGRSTKHTVQFAGHRHRIYEATHSSKLWVPDREPLDVAPMAVAMPYAADRKAYFVLATPEFMAERKFKGESSGSTAFRNVLSGLAMHELAHTRQLPQLMPIIDGLQKRHRFPESIDDNLIETTFAQNAEFKAMYDKAAGHMQTAVMATDDEAAAREHAREALRVIRGWQKQFLTGEREGWATMEDVFLTLEGAGQWVLYKHALRKAQPGQAWQQTLIHVASATDSWSQSIGLGLFLLMDRFVPNWGPEFFLKSPPPSPVAVLERALASGPR